MFQFKFVVAYLLFTITVACSSKASDNLQDQPKKWCSISARLTTGQRQPCNLEVEEIFSVPWVPKALSRVLITPTGRIDVKNIAASQVIKNTRVPVRVNVPQPTTTETLRINVTLEASQPTTEKARFILRYTIIDGLRIFDDCSEDKGKFNKTSGTMMGLWKPGIVAPQIATKITVTFDLPYRHVIHNPPTYAIPTPTTLTQTDKSTIVRFNTTTFDGATAYYIRFTPRSSSAIAKCSGYRICDNEFRANREKPLKTSGMGIRLWLALGCSLLLAAFIAALIAVCCLRRGKAGDGDNDSDNSQFSAQNAGAGGFREKDDQVDDSPRATEAEEIYIKDVTSANAGGNRFGWTST